MNAPLIVFFVLAVMAVLGAVSLILQRHPIHSALSLIVVMVALAGLYLLMGAEFVAAVQIIVYGGAIMVLFVFRRNIITIFMSIELMLNAVNLAFVAFSQAWNRLDGQVFVLFVIVVAAAEAAVGLGITILIQRNRQSLNVERVDLLKLYC